MPRILHPTSFRLVTFCVALAALSACSSGSVSFWFGDSLSLYSLDSDPGAPHTNDSVTLTAKAAVVGDINDEDLSWNWEQTSGRSVSNTWQEQVGKSSRLHFTAPGSSGDIEFQVTVKGRGMRDNASIRLYVRN